MDRHRGRADLPGRAPGDSQGDLRGGGPRRHRAARQVLAYRAPADSDASAAFPHFVGDRHAARLRAAADPPRRGRGTRRPRDDPGPVDVSLRVHRGRIWLRLRHRRHPFRFHTRFDLPQQPVRPDRQMKGPVAHASGVRARRDWPQHAVVGTLLAIELFPLYMMFQVSFKDNATFIANPWLPSSPLDWRWENWLFAFKLVGPYIANTLFVAGTATILTLLLAILAAYFFARYRMPFARLFWAVFMTLMLLPGVANIVPLFMLLRELSLLNTLWALIVVGVSAGQAFNIFVLRGFVEDLPKDLFEAAEMDGAGHLAQIRHIVIPMSAPIIGTLAILTFLNKWNDFLLPLIVLRDKSLFTLGVGLIYLDGEYVKQWGPIMAAYFFAALPLIVLFLFTMRLFVRGLSQGAIKG